MKQEPVDPRVLEQLGWKQRALPGHIGHVGPLWTRSEPEGWAYGILVREQHLNPAGVVHGGLIATLIDHALSSIAWQASGRQPCITAQMNVQYLEAARLGQFLIARGRIVRGGGSLAFVSGHVQVGEVPLAQASAVLKVLGTRSTLSSSEQASGTTEPPQRD